jgi:hypothetical protein
VIEAPLDVLVAYEDADAAAAATCAAAFEREGWSVFRSNGLPGRLPAARAYVVVWSEASIRSARLARESREPLERKLLLQLLVQPRKGPGDPVARRKNVIEPPPPFCYHQGLPVTSFDVDGSDRAIDSFGHSGSDGDTILKEVARLGGLKRPGDAWNARIVFAKPWSGTVEAVTASEYAAEDGRLLRRFEIDHNNSFLETAFQTSIGARWRVTSQRRGVVVRELEVIDGDNHVDLPRRARWWQRLGGW